MKRCPYCGGKKIDHRDGMIICLDCGESDLVGGICESDWGSD